MFSALPSIGTEIGALGVFGSTFAADPVKLHLAAAILLSGLCFIFVQGKSLLSATVLRATFIVFGFSLGVLVTPIPLNRFFLIGIFCFAAFSLFRSGPPGIRRTVSLFQLSLAVILILASFVWGNTFSAWAGLFLAVTLLPLTPFHMPFLSIISSAEGLLSGFWIVVLLALGLAELHTLPNPLLTEGSLIIQLLGLVSALYASLKCLAENQFRRLIAYAAVAQIALLWGIQQVFLDFSKWGLQFGMAVAFVMSGLLCIHTFLQKRYGSHLLGKFPGLASAMPRLGTLLILLISIAMFLPLVPTFAGLTTMLPLENSDVFLPIILLTVCAVWMLGSWYFTHLLHQTAFGKPQPDIPYTDLQPTEVGAVTLFIIAASYSGFIILK